MSARASLDVIYCEGWSPEDRAIVGRLSAATARERDRGGQQYAFCLVRPEDDTVVAVGEIARGRGFARCWHFDEQGRRHRAVEYRELGRLFRAQVEQWHYDGPTSPEFDERADYERLSHEPDGTATRTVRAQQARSKMVRPVRVPVEELFSDVPGFGDWAALAGVDADLVERPDVVDEEPVEPPWRPPVPLRPTALDRVFRSGERWGLRGAEEVVVTEVRDAGTVRLISGRVLATDPGLLSDGEAAFTDTVPPGDYRVELAVVRFVDDPEHERVAAAKLVVSAEPVVSWHLALRPGQDDRLLGDGEFYGFGVDSGTACFVDADAAEALDPIFDRSFEEIAERLIGGASERVADPVSGAALVAFGSGWGDGSYPTWVGRAADGSVACFVVDLLVLHRATPQPAVPVG